MRIGTTASVIAACLLAAPAVVGAQPSRGNDRISAMDRNGDGVVTRHEWTGAADAFEARDWNRDGILSGSELRPGAKRGQARRSRDEEPWSSRDDRAVSSMDSDHNGQLTRREWRGSRDEFDRRDGNRDGLLSGTELRDIDGTFEGRARWQGGPSDNRSRAYRAGAERGRMEGLDAGRQDRERNQGWDLEGQRELETADSGYTADLGPRAEYQAGYRDAFRAAYRDGFGR